MRLGVAEETTRWSELSLEVCRGLNKLLEVMLRLPLGQREYLGAERHSQGQSLGGILRGYIVFRHELCNVQGGVLKFENVASIVACGNFCFWV